MDHAHDDGHGHHHHHHGAGVDHGHHHHHDHGHDHGEAHLQQLLTIFISGAFGVAGVLMYTLHDTVQGQSLRKLEHVLAPAFHPWVLAGAIVLLVLTAFRGYCLWVQVGQHNAAHSHDHDHDHAGHDHAPGEACNHPSHGHDHDHGDHTAEDHDHGNIYWRVIVLAVPIAFLAMGLPNGGFSEERIKKILGDAKELGPLEEVAAKDAYTFATFDELANTSYSEQLREEFTGKIATIAGQIRPLEGGSGREFTLFFEKVTCCKTDSQYLKARGLVKSNSQLDRFRSKGFPVVIVTGKLQYAEDSPGNFIPVIRVQDSDGIKLK